MKTVVILYEHVSREYETCIRVKDYLVKNDIANAYVFSMHFQINEVYKIASKRIIDILAVPYAYKEKSLNKILLLIKRNRIKLVFNLRHEQIGASYNEFKLYPRDYFTQNYIYHSAWTEIYKNKLIEKGVPSDHIIITQNPRADLLFSQEHQNIADRSVVAKKYGINQDKKWIIICESGPVRSNEMIQQMIIQGYNQQDLQEYNEFTINDLKKTE